MTSGRISALALLIVLVLLPRQAPAQDPIEQALKDFTPLISHVRGAVRSLMEQGKGCLPAAALAKDPAHPGSFVQFGFTADMVKELALDSGGAIGARLSAIATEGPFTASAIAICETDAVFSDKSPNVIALFLERRGGLALKVRFPFVQSVGGQIDYIANKVGVSRTPSLVFRQAAMPAAPQSGTPARPALAAVLYTQEHQWVFNHICVPVRLLPAAGYTNRDFVDAYYAVTQARWDATLEAVRRGDQNAAMAAFASIAHGMIDLHWPNRVERDASGAITRFRDCDDLGNLQGALREEKAGPGPTAEVAERSTHYLSQVIGKWKAGRPFAEVAEILRSGPMKLSETHADAPLDRK